MKISDFVEQYKRARDLHDGIVDMMSTQGRYSRDKTVLVSGYIVRAYRRRPSVRRKARLRLVAGGKE